MLAERIMEIIDECGYSYLERPRSIYTTCPVCGTTKKFSILKKNGASICYRGSCDFGKRWFEDWIALTKGIERFEAKKYLHGNNDGEPMSLPKNCNLAATNPFDYDPMSELEALNWPSAGAFPLDHELSQDGVEYLKTRGIPKKLAEYHDIMYSPIDRRIVIPIKNFGTCYGYQARSIDKVLPQDRMRNNIGFRRDRMVMFCDEAMAYDHIIITEGPFDGLKFAKIGGYISTLGKEISDHQIELIHNLDPNKVFVALDSDAQKEAYQLAISLRTPGREVYNVSVPQSCIDRCKSQDKKYDFGECTFDEAVQAIQQATLLFKD